MKDLPKRALTALIFGAVMIGGILWSRLSFSILVFIINAGCLYEYLKLVRKFQKYSPGQSTIAFSLTMICGVALHAAGLLLANDPFVFLLAGFVLPMIILLIVAEFILNTESKMKNALLNAGGIIYVSLFLFCFYVLAAPPFILDSSNTIEWFPRFASIPLGIVLIIWANDTFAYFSGSLLGKHKIAPAISPKKSWEGFFGGMIFAIIAAWIISRFFFELNVADWMMIAFIIVVFGTTGDFFESFMKRKAGVIDSGNLLAGHGGFLDRFDAMLFCLPFVTLYMISSHGL